MDNRVIDNWIEAYTLAWRTPGTDLLKEVFSEDIVYTPGPYRDPVTGLKALAAFWEKTRDPNEVFELSYELVATEGDIVVMKTQVTYTKPEQQTWKNIWIMQFQNDGLCFSFEEWPFSPDQNDGQE